MSQNIQIGIMLWLLDYHHLHYRPMPLSVIVFNLVGWVLIIEVIF